MTAAAADDNGDDDDDDDDDADDMTVYEATRWSQSRLFLNGGSRSVHQIT